MILGYETPVELPTMSVFDKDMMKMYLNALHEDYREGVEALKEFNKNFGDFVSISAPDTLNWYNLTTAPIQEFLNKNPNAIRSVEGRAELARLLNQIASDPRLALLKQAAKQYLDTQDAYNKMAANGIPIMNKQDLSNWDTLSKGTFSEAPLQQKSLDQLLAPTIETLKGQYKFNEKKSADTGGKYRVSDIDPARVAEQMQTTLTELKKGPYYNYYKNDSGLSEEDFDKMLIQHVSDSLGDEYKIDPYKKAEYEEKLKYNSTIKAQNNAARIADAAQAQKHKDKMEEIAAKSGNSNAGSKSITYDMYNSSNISNNIREYNEETVRNGAQSYTDKKFQKQLKGATPQQQAKIRNSKEYQKAYRRNYTFWQTKERDRMRREQENTANLAVQKGTVRSLNSSGALATSIGAEAINSLYKTLNRVKYDSNGNMSEFIFKPGELYTTTGITERRTGRKHTINGKYIGRKSFSATSGTQSTHLKNFIQQIETDGKVHWYIRVNTSGTNEDAWHHVGSYQPISGDQFLQEVDKDWLNAVKLNVKPITTPFLLDGEGEDSDLFTQLLTLSNQD